MLRMSRAQKSRALTGLIYGVFGVIVLIGTLAFGRYVSKGTSVDTNAVMAAGVLVGMLAFSAISGIVRPRRR
jgi:predicted MFS family arabinose efflux permease